MKEEDGGKEKRKSPRYSLDLPVEYRVVNVPDAYGGMLLDGSEIGLRIQSVKDLPVGTRLNIGVIFPWEYQVSNFEAVAEIVWKNPYQTKDWSGYQYGLKFYRIQEEDLHKLKRLLKNLGV